MSRGARGRAAAHRRFRDPVVLGLGALVLALAAGVGSLAHRAGGTADDFPLRIEITPPRGGAPAEPLFTGSYDIDFDVAPDGRFLVIESESAGPTLVVVPSWRTELRRLTAQGGVR